jgi:hypothetical protein
MFKKHIVFIYTLTAFLFVSCERTKEVDIDILQDNKYVVYSFISPIDETLIVYVTKSVPVIGSGNNVNTEFVSDAQVFISDGTTEILLTYNPVNTQYESQSNELPVIEGKTYTARVIAADGKSITTSCTVPFSFNPQVALEIDSSEKAESTTNLVMKMKWNDAVQYKNYYRVAGLAYVVNDVSGFYDTSLVTLFANEDAYFYSDEANNGGEIKAELFTQYNHLTEHIVRVQTLLVVCDENYYQYHKSVNKGMYTFGWDNPVFIYSNVKNGLGAFGSYNEVVLTDKWLR